MTRDSSRVIVDRIAANPRLATFGLATPGDAVLAPLEEADEPALASFFDGLSARSRRFYSVSDSAAEAHSRCSAIARYDKLRLALRTAGAIVALSEFSFDLHPGDMERFAGYGIHLPAGRVCRWGLCVADSWQRRGVGTAIAAASFDLAERLAQEIVILWGGVQVANEAAIRFYGTIGFTEVGRFANGCDMESIDMIKQLLRDQRV